MLLLLSMADKAFSSDFFDIIVQDDKELVMRGPTKVKNGNKYTVAWAKAGRGRFVLANVNMNDHQVILSKFAVSKIGDHPTGGARKAPAPKTKAAAPKTKAAKT